MDVVDSTTRSRMMAGIRSKNTQPEMIVRKYLHAQGLRFRLHARNLPGSPDLALPKYKVAIFVHGCFWHRHARCRFATTPSSNIAHWNAKFAANIDRDARQVLALQEAGWRVITIWECELKRTRDDRLSSLIGEITDQGLETHVK
jgi:DNA mismatch endonuclease (patch repair protein)